MQTNNFSHIRVVPAPAQSSQWPGRPTRASQPTPPTSLTSGANLVVRSSEPNLQLPPLVTQASRSSVASQARAAELNAARSRTPAENCPADDTNADIAASAENMPKRGPRQTWKKLSLSDLLGTDHVSCPGETGYERPGSEPLGHSNEFTFAELNSRSRTSITFGSSEAQFYSCTENGSHALTSDTASQDELNPSVNSVKSEQCPSYPVTCSTDQKDESFTSYEEEAVSTKTMQNALAMEAAGYPYRDGSGAGLNDTAAAPPGWLPGYSPQRLSYAAAPGSPRDPNLHETAPAAPAVPPGFGHSDHGRHTPTHPRQGPRDALNNFLVHSSRQNYQFGGTDPRGTAPPQPPGLSVPPASQACHPSSYWRPSTQPYPNEPLGRYPALTNVYDYVTESYPNHLQQIRSDLQQSRVPSTRYIGQGDLDGSYSMEPVGYAPHQSGYALGSTATVYLNGPGRQDRRGPDAPRVHQKSAAELQDDISTYQRSARHAIALVNSRVAAADEDLRASNFSDNAPTRAKTEAAASRADADSVLVDLLIPALAQLSTYSTDSQNYRYDHFNHMTARPAWAVDHGPEADQTFFEPPWGAPPRRLARDPRYAPMHPDFGRPESGGGWRR